MKQLVKNNTKNTIAKKIYIDLLSGSNKYKHLSANEILHIINLFIKQLKLSFINEQPVQLRFFGSFLPVTRKPKVGRNPKKPTVTFLIPLKKSVNFKLSKKIIKELNP
jgi:DNA-binding protein HU-beta